MTFNEKKKSHIDKDIFRILGLLEKTALNNKTDSREESSLTHQIPDDWSDKVIDSPIIENSTVLGKTIALRECYKGLCIGFNETAYKEFDKFISMIYKEKEINSVISREFVEKKTLDWLFNAYRLNKVETTYSSYILDEMQVSIKEYKIHYSILYLNINKPIQLGKVYFEFFTKDYFDQLVKSYSAKNSGKDNPYELMRKEYQGKVYATYRVSAERSKAKEIALQQCSLAVDILKMCSQTTNIPQLQLSFDIDSRTKENAKNEVILTDPNLPEESFSVDFYRIPSQHKIHDAEWKIMESMGIEIFHKFLLKISINVSELEQLIINGIKRYGNAISNPGIHQRVVELFTILESLLLNDRDSTIIESVCKYCSKLVFKKPEDRKDLIKLLKNMYEVRSSLIHHAKEIPFEINNLKKLQYIVIMLLQSLINKSDHHQTKQSLLTEIDDAILKAY